MLVEMNKRLFYFIDFLEQLGSAIEFLKLTSKLVNNGMFNETDIPITGIR